MTESQNKKIFNDLERILTLVRWLIIFGFGAGVWITRLEFRVSATESDLSKITIKMEQILANNIETSLAMREISTDLKYIKENTKRENQNLPR